MAESKVQSSHKLQTASIEGTLLMLDDTTPHVAVPVQAICNGKVIATTQRVAQLAQQAVCEAQETLK